MFIKKIYEGDFGTTVNLTHTEKNPRENPRHAVWVFDFMIYPQSLTRDETFQVCLA